MRVSIAIPVYNSSEYIISTLESVKNQDYTEIELLLYDDFSKDQSCSIIENWLMINTPRFTRVFFERGNINRGVSFAGQILLRNSCGNYFQLLGADDILLPSKISNQVLFLQKNDYFSMVYSNAYRIDKYGNRLDKNYFEFQKFESINSAKGPSGFLYNKLIHENFIPAPSFLAKRKELMDIGGYDTELRIEDWDLWLRVSKNFKIGFIDSIDVEYRIHEKQTIHNKLYLSAIFKSYLIMFNKHYGFNLKNDIILRLHFNKYAIGAYRYGDLSSKFLYQNFILNKSIKSFIYFMLAIFRLRINQMK